jgi:hypothetical protein
MVRKILTIGALGLVLAVSSCRNPDDRMLSAAAQYAAQ